MVGQKGLDLQVGNLIRYKNKNAMIHPEAIYEGVVTEVYGNYFRVFGTPIRDTMHEDKKSFWGPAIPYYFCVPKYLDIITERFQVVDQLTDVNTELIKQYNPNLAQYFDVAEQMSA